jgi:hypothetical protein
MRHPHPNPLKGTPVKNSKTRSHLRRVRVGITSGILVVVAAVALAACTGSSGGGSQSAVNASNSTAQIEYNEFTKAVPYPYANAAPSNPLERENAARRLVEYNSKGDTNYVYIQTFSGQVVGYYITDGKVSSTSTEMTSTQQVTNCGDQNKGDGGGCSVTDAIGDDGTYGGEEGGQFGVFFFTASGTLVETDDPVIISSEPIALYTNVPQLDARAK